MRLYFPSLSHEVIYRGTQKTRTTVASKPFITKYVMRPICSNCNKLPRRVNYIRDGVRHYRSLCGACSRSKEKLPTPKPRWMSGGYKKKSSCDCCGFRCTYTSQMIVYHINGNLEDISLHNLRTVCLNCVEIVKRTQINWRRGDLQVDG